MHERNHFILLNIKYYVKYILYISICYYISIFPLSIMKSLKKNRSTKSLFVIKEQSMKFFVKIFIVKLAFAHRLLSVASCINIS